MSEWRLFPEGTVPDFTTTEFFAAHGWVPPLHQVGHAERMAMTADIVRTLLLNGSGIETIWDLGCGDGSLLEKISPWEGVTFQGFDSGTENIEIAVGKGLDVSFADILTLDTSGVDLVIASEVIEHMLDPHFFVASIQSRYAVFTSPAHEDDQWHYGHHAWAWDEEGYAQMVTDAGWKILRHETCEAPAVDHGYGPRAQRYQAIVARRELV